MKFQAIILRRTDEDSLESLLKQAVLTAAQHTCDAMFEFDGKRYTAEYEHLRTLVVETAVELEKQDEEK